jgi:hypothetical protein
MNDVICETEGTLIFNKFEYAGQCCTFKEGQELSVRYSKYSIEDFITVEYDFGMMIKESCDVSSGFLGLNKNSSIEEIVKRTVTFDLEHSFCHPSEDPNYTTMHWAIYGWLKDRVIIAEMEFE